MVDWDLWRTIEELAFAGSFASAAKRLKVDATTVKRKKETLEAQLGRQLFVREDGQLIPTPACRKALVDVRAAARLLDSAHATLAPAVEQRAWGKCVITSLQYLCERLLGPATGRLPPEKRLRVELVGGDRNLSLAGEAEADIALRLGPTSTAGIAAWHIADLTYSSYSSIDLGNEPCPWITLDRSHSHLPEVRIPEQHAGVEGVKFTATSVGTLERIAEVAAVKVMLPRFIGDQNRKLKRLQDHPEIVRPVWLMWREDLRDEPYFGNIICWIVDEVYAHARPTGSAAALLEKYRDKPD